MPKNELAPETIDHANRVIGDKRICGIRDGKKARFFIAEDYHGEAVVTEVSNIIARITNSRRTDSGWVCTRRICGDPCDHLLDLYNEKMGRPKRANLRP